MNAPEKPRRRPRALREGETLVVRHPGDPAKFRRIAAEVRAHLPKPKRGESIARALAEARLRNYR